MPRLIKGAVDYVGRPVFRTEIVVRVLVEQVGKE